MQITQNTSPQARRQFQPQEQARSTSTLSILDDFSPEPIGTTVAGVVGTVLGAAGGAGAAALGWKGLAVASAGTALLGGAASGWMTKNVDGMPSAGPALGGGILFGGATAIAGGIALATGRPILAGALIGGASGIALGAFVTGTA